MITDRDLKNVNWMAILPWSALFCVAMIAVYVHHEVPAYTWDYGGYWHMFHGFGEAFSEDFNGAFRQMLGAVKQNDYNPSAQMPLMPFYFLFGGSRISYVTAVALTYLVPAAIITSLVYKAISGSQTVPLVAFVAAMTFIPFWAPTLRGLPDIVGVCFLGAGTLVAFRTRFLTRASLLTAVVLGILIYVPFLLRRWYAFSIVAYCLVAYCFGVFYIWREKSGFSAFVGLTLRFGIAGLLAIFLALALQFTLIERVLSTSYADIYSAYQTSWQSHLWTFLSRTTPLMLAMMAFGFCLAIQKRSAPALFCALTATLTYALFARTQQPGTHHFLPVAMWLAPFVIWSFVEIAQRFRFGEAMMVSVSLIIFLASVSSISVSYPSAAFLFVQREYIGPLQLENYPNYQKMTSDLMSLTSTGDKFVVFATGSKLSDSLIRELEPELEKTLVHSPQLAKRDFFFFDVLKAKYAIVPEKPVSDLPVSDTLNVTLPGQWIVEHKGFGSAYRRLDPVYALAVGINASIYIRERNFSMQEVSDLTAALEAEYPFWGSRLRQDMSISFASMSPHPGEVWGRVEATENTMFIHPGAATPTFVELPIDDSIATPPDEIVVSVPTLPVASCAGADGVHVNIAADQQSLWSGALSPGAERVIAISIKSGMLKISVGPRSQPTCDYVNILFRPQRH